ncbi:phage holin family protein [Flavobacterium sp. RHBU_24]|uniref:phage holin family protein n=1 Tax=Flavobacterium sp. RHBU_24 TaxID=3391185 RepID=UPI003984EA60
MKTLQYLTSSLLSFFLPVHGLLIAVGFAIVLDTFTGVFKSVKINGWHSVRSRKLSDVVGKVVLYNTAILSIYIMDFYLLSGFFKYWFSADFFFTKIIALVLIVIELTSIKENFEAAYKKDIWKLLKSILRRAKEIEDISDLKP